MTSFHVTVKLVNISLYKDCILIKNMYMLKQYANFQVSVLKIMKSSESATFIRTRKKYSVHIQ